MVSGLGGEDPYVDNRSASGRAKNNRVEIVFLYHQISRAGGAQAALSSGPAGSRRPSRAAPVCTSAQVPGNRRARRVMTPSSAGGAALAASALSCHSSSGGGKHDGGRPTRWRARAMRAPRRRTGRPAAATATAPAAFAPTASAATPRARRRARPATRSRPPGRARSSRPAPAANDFGLPEDELDHLRAGRNLRRQGGLPKIRQRHGLPARHL